MTYDANELAEHAAALGLPLGAEVAADLAALVGDLTEPLVDAERLDGDGDRGRLASPVAAAGRRPRPGEDPLGAVVRWLDAPPLGDGPLAGVRVAVKDAIAVAGAPLAAGFPPLGRFVAERDSAVVTRLRAAGARIVATTRMDCLGMAAGGETCGDGEVRNPHDPTRTAGGSSGGAAASLSLPGVDVAVGCDQGGSIRVPASWCGLLGLKPTRGLVPTAGTVGIEATLDHVGPLARTVGELAATLDALVTPAPGDVAGASADLADGLPLADQTGVAQAAAAPRAAEPSPSQAFTRAVADAPTRLDGLRVGVLAEGLSAATGVEPQTAASARDAARALAALGAAVRTVTAPEHLRAGGATLVINFAGIVALLAGASGLDFGDGPSPRFARALRDALAEHGGQLSPQVQLAWAVGAAQARRHRGVLRAQALRFAARLRAAYDRALDEVDVLLMPTTPFPAYRLGQGGGVRGLLERGWSMLANTEPLNLSGHPAISLPTGTVDGLPVGTMLVGRHGADAQLLAIAAAWERAHGWRGSPPRLDTNREVAR